MAYTGRGTAAPQNNGVWSILSGFGWKGWTIVGGGILVALVVAGMVFFCGEESPSDSSSSTSTGGGSGDGGVEDASNPDAPSPPPLRGVEEEVKKILGGAPSGGGSLLERVSPHEHGVEPVSSPPPEKEKEKKKKKGKGKGKGKDKKKSKPEPEPSGGSSKGGESEKDSEIKRLREELSKFKSLAAWGAATTLALYFWGLWLFFLSLSLPLDRLKFFGKPGELILFGVLGILLGSWVFTAHYLGGDMPSWVYWLNAIGGGVLTLIGILSSPKGAWKVGLIGLAVLALVTGGAYLFCYWAPSDWWL